MFIIILLRISSTVNKILDNNKLLKSKKYTLDYFKAKLLNSFIYKKYKLLKK